MGQGFVLAISRRRSEPDRAYRDRHRERAGNDFGLGATQLVQVRPDVWVANMVAQRGIRSVSSGPPIRYDVVARCLTTIAEYVLQLGASVHLPRIGCGLTGGRRERIEPVIAENFAGSRRTNDCVRLRLTRRELRGMCGCSDAAQLSDLGDKAREILCRVRDEIDDRVQPGIR